MSYTGNLADNQGAKMIGPASLQTAVGTSKCPANYILVPKSAEDTNPYNSDPKSTTNKTYQYCWASPVCSTGRISGLSDSVNGPRCVDDTNTLKKNATLGCPNWNYPTQPGGIAPTYPIYWDAASNQWYCQIPGTSS